LSADLGEGAAATTSLFTGAVILVVLFLLALAGYRLWQPRQASSTADATDGVA
jgi:TRAP-type C4-dicarboxylate transport system permease small subunit